MFLCVTKNRFCKLHFMWTPKSCLLTRNQHIEAVKEDLSLWSIKYYIRVSLVKTTIHLHYQDGCQENWLAYRDCVCGQSRQRLTHIICIPQNTKRFCNLKYFTYDTHFERKSARRNTFNIMMGMIRISVTASELWSHLLYLDDLTIT